MIKGNAERLFNHQFFIIRFSNKKRPWSMNRARGDVAN